jgi:D-alanyl-D-alanine carboxypeptidase
MGHAPTYLARLRELHRELGIPEDYSVLRRLTLHEEASTDELVEIGRNPDGRLLELVPPAAAAWRLLRNEAANDGLELIAVSAFRSVARQTEIIRRKLDDGKSIAEILRYVAAPGFSEHHTGRAIDIGCPGFTDLEENFETTPAFAWLQRRAGRHGFSLSYPRGSETGIGYEPWHWLWRPDPER